MKNYIIIFSLFLFLFSCSSARSFDGATANLIFEANKTPIVKVTPAYPKSALNQGVEGRVEMQFVVGEKNTPVNIEIIRSAGEPLDSAAVRALQKAFYHPKNIGKKFTAIAEFTLNKN